MTDADPPIDPRPFREDNTPWSDRVVYSPRAGGIARRPGKVLTASADAAARAAEFAEGRKSPIELDDATTVHVVEWDEAGGGRSVESVVDLLRAQGWHAEPDYVMFAHPVYANPVYANPVYANPVYANPVYANPVYANPVYANPVYANPVYANPVYASPVYANPVYSNPVYANAYICDGTRPSTARPAARPFEMATYDQAAAAGRVVVFDTGIATTKKNDRNEVMCPPPLVPLASTFPNQRELPDNAKAGKAADSFLDPASGHGTFIAGILQGLAPGTQIVPWSVVTSFGDVSVTTVLQAVKALVAANLVDEHTIVNMSFGGYADEQMAFLGQAVRLVQDHDGVVVASAGNDATDRPSFPACLPGVVGVGSVDAVGPAPYSNHGSWVRACAPGSDVVSSFFDWNGAMEVPKMPGSADPDDFRYWARWTGTSFAAPMVAAALVRHMAATGTDAPGAVREVVDAPGLFRIPGLGTVVNLRTAEPNCL